jgi:hypothetical protein
VIVATPIVAGVFATGARAELCAKVGQGAGWAVAGARAGLCGGLKPAE